MRAGVILLAFLGASARGCFLRGNAPSAEVGDGGLEGVDIDSGLHILHQGVPQNARAPSQNRNMRPIRAQRRVGKKALREACVGDPQFFSCETRSGAGSALDLMRCLDEKEEPLSTDCALAVYNWAILLGETSNGPRSPGATWENPLLPGAVGNAHAPEKLDVEEFIMPGAMEQIFKEGSRLSSDIGEVPDDDSAVFWHEEPRPRPHQFHHHHHDGHHAHGPHGPPGRGPPRHGRGPPPPAGHDGPHGPGEIDHHHRHHHERPRSAFGVLMDWLFQDSSSSDSSDSSSSDSSSSDSSSSDSSGEEVPIEPSWSYAASDNSMLESVKAEDAGAVAAGMPEGTLRHQVGIMRMPLLEESSTNGDGHSGAGNRRFHRSKMSHYRPQAEGVAVDRRFDLPGRRENGRNQEHQLPHEHQFPHHYFQQQERGDHIRFRNRMPEEYEDSSAWFDELEFDDGCDFVEGALAFFFFVGAFTLLFLPFFLMGRALKRMVRRARRSHGDDTVSAAAADGYQALPDVEDDSIVVTGTPVNPPPSVNL